MPKLILIDDEHGPMDLYVRALRQSGFDVEHLDSVELALKHIQETDAPADLYIIDLMMPPGNALDLEQAGFGLKSGIEVHRALRKAAEDLESDWKEETESGLKTGVAIHRRLRQKFRTVPVIILTSVSNPAIIDAIPFDDFTGREAKIEVLPFELVEIVRKTLGTSEHE